MRRLRTCGKPYCRQKKRSSGVPAFRGQPCLRWDRIEQGVTLRGQSSQIDGLRLKSQGSPASGAAGLNRV